MSADVTRETHNDPRERRTASYAMRASAMFIVLALAVIAAPQLAHGACMTDSSVEAFFEGLVSYRGYPEARPKTNRKMIESDLPFHRVRRSRQRGVGSERRRANRESLEMFVESYL